MSHPFHLNAVKAAVLSDDRRHRYWLTRIWDRARPVLVVCMFNPSTADGQRDDQTILRLFHFGKAWGYGGILVINLYTLRTSDPHNVRGHESVARGDAHYVAWNHALDIARAQKTPVLVAWGNLPTRDAVDEFMRYAFRVPLICLGRTREGGAIHPMARGKHRVPDDRQPVPYP